MSLKVAAESFPTPPSLVVVRDYNHGRDKVAVEELERECEVTGKQGKPSVLTDMGDPISRIRNFPSHIMLVAEYGIEGEIVGVIRGGIKSVTRTNIEASTELPVYVRLACIFGLRVSSAHRRLGIGIKLVQELEERCRELGAQYTYMATECSNQPSVNLFTIKSNYIKFRRPTVLVQPVHAHQKPLGSGTALIRVPPNIAELMYRRIFANNSEFFPQDIDVILKNKLNLGTFMAVPKKCLSNWDIKSGIFPPSYAILSIWNTKEVYRLKVEGCSLIKYAGCRGSWALDKFFPWLRLPSVPNIFKYFGYYFLFGLHMEGKNGRSLMKSLCGFAHNMASGDSGCCFVVAEVNQKDPIREAIPHWKVFSWGDLWCMKRLTGPAGKEERIRDWINSSVSSPAVTTFVDPREF